MSDTLDIFKEYFYGLAKIPHGSGNEKAIAEYVLDECIKLGCRAERDEYNNVIAFAPGIGECKNAPAVLLDAHLDMVCVENDGKNRDFATVPVEAYEDGDFIKAKGTSLGGDALAGVAMMLTLLRDDFSRPPLELLFTSSEETGMDGARGFDYSKVSARTVINLDSESEDEVVIGCAGGEMAKMVFSDESKIRNPFKTLKITVKGLAGGHSGADIGTGKYNANRVIGELLAHLYEKQRFTLVSINGGTKDNVITDSACAVIAVEDREAAEKILKKAAASLYDAAIKDDLGMKVLYDFKGTSEESFTFATTSGIISALTLPKYGVIERYGDSFPMTSQNVGVVKTEGNSVTVEYLIRSAFLSRLDNMEVWYRRFAGLTGCKLELYGRYPGWDSGRDNKLAKRYADVYRKINNKEIKTVKMHAGVECGLIFDGLGGGEVISIGPDIFDIHSPDEKLSISSCKRVYNTVRALLTEMK